MGKVGTFLERLESSTIHGVAYIAIDNRKHVKLFWITVVISALSFAGMENIYIIYLKKCLSVILKLFFRLSAQ